MKEHTITPTPQETQEIKRLVLALNGEMVFNIGEIAREIYTDVGLPEEEGWSNSDGWGFTLTAAALYEMGRIKGIRQERNRHRNRSK